MARIVTLNDLVNKPRKDPLTACPITVLAAVVCSLLTACSLHCPRFIAFAALDPHLLFYKQQCHRILLCHFVHADLLHLILNIFSFVGALGPGVGCRMEEKLGKRAFAVCLVTGLVFQPLLYSLLNFLLVNVVKETSAVGFSGIIFQLVTLESLLVDPSEKREHWIGMTFPVRITPLVSLIEAQAFGSLRNANVSFLGHLAGILVGLLQATFMAKCKGASLSSRSLQQHPWHPIRMAAQALSFPQLAMTCTTQENKVVPVELYQSFQSHDTKSFPSITTNIGDVLRLAFAESKEKLSEVAKNLCGPVATSSQNGVFGPCQLQPFCRKKVVIKKGVIIRAKPTMLKRQRTKTRTMRQKYFESRNGKKVVENTVKSAVKKKQGATKRKRTNAEASAQESASKRMRSIGPTMQWRI